MITALEELVTIPSLPLGFTFICVFGCNIFVADVLEKVAPTHENKELASLQRGRVVTALEKCYCAYLFLYKSANPS